MTFFRCATCLTWTDTQNETMVVDSAGEPVTDNGCPRWICPVCAEKYGRPTTSAERFTFLQDVFRLTWRLIGEVGVVGESEEKARSRALSFAAEKGYGLP